MLDIIRILKDIGVPAKEASSSLVNILNKEVENQRVKAEVALLLGKIGPEEGVVEALINGLDDKHFDIVWNCIVALEKFGSSAEDAIPVLRRLYTEGGNCPLFAKFGPARELVKGAIEKIESGMSER